MKRRDFFKLGAGISAATLANNLSANSFEIANNTSSREFEISLNHKLSETGESIRFWLALPLSSQYQQLISNYTIQTNAKEYFVSDLEIPTLYANFANNEKEPFLNIKFKIRTFNRSTDFSKFNPKGKFEKDILKYLKPTGHISLSPVVKSKAQEVVRNINANDELKKAHAIYSWVADNMERDESVIGCGVGDAAAILQSGKLSGKCTDIGSVFVALCRAVGVPAREVFGIRVGKSSISTAIGKSDEKGFADITKAQHCRVEFYARGIGWIAADPADVTKVRLAEKLTNQSTKIIELKEYLFGNWEGCWIGFNHGRDFDLKPKAAIRPMNNFGYPYAEIDDQALNYYSPNRFSYSYSSQEIL